MPTSAPPALGQIVHYRGKHGLQAARAAIVTADVDSLDPRGVEAGDIPALDSQEHVHLWVFTPGETGGFTEYNIAPAGPRPADDSPEAYPAPGTWCWPPRT